ncbi:hypothetical protein CIL05_07125 [Virgibacillus profundi]|uniref:Uncharacterized protein n=1 Tax=Virgibacillus profundi TaxID=2024555 RepID=A0A2A2IFA3_9BACI|nr:hypothetical protein [Virgibacillus profundi]PAV30232.1 hypothetical protein CIL05_07125 [Virgibacillus profundi]PXY54404.1 hypothetical protein CIT14_07210 [Virgibacillus profundi]
MDLNKWKQDIHEQYVLLQTNLKNIKHTSLYTSLQNTINNRDETSCTLNDFLENHFQLSNIYNQFHQLQSERLEWLKEYTNSNSIKDNEYYRHMAYKVIHEDIVLYSLQLIMNDHTPELTVQQNKLQHT